MHGLLKEREQTVVKPSGRAYLGAKHLLQEGWSQALERLLSPWSRVLAPPQGAVPMCCFRRRPGGSQV